ncbi:Uncharacterized protein FKW44_009811 [Caligus rogercresseyi]|uniref:HECT-type E3 ubiquitin transferase n=1 Tax=Caligus rogercresseyi TaxID=217165 RepID=A0A7T8HGT0_CALRO|nr:Uncharacterized protein FKW44_009811 [Caligus rogercresseyi]
MKAVSLIIQRTNETEYLPVAHTCFNILDLPDYQSRETLSRKLLISIQCTQGFGLA